MALKVSIIIPVYGVSKYIERCIKSVLNQTYDHIECIIVDDCTPDDSITKCEQLLAHYQGPIQFTILHHERNRGLSAARNTGTDAATGDYLFYLDSDDEITPDCIEKLSKPVLNDATIEIVAGNMEMFYDNPSQPPTLRSTSNIQIGDINSNKEVRDHFFLKNGGINNAATNKLIKRSFLQQHRLYFKEGILWEDILWFFFVVKKLNHLFVIPDAIMHYYLRPNSILTGSNDEKRVHHLGMVYKEIADHPTEGEEGREAGHYVRGFCSRCFIYDPKNQTSLYVAKRFKEALSNSPYTSARRYLSITLFLSKFYIGRKFFIVGSKLSRKIRKIG